MSEKDIKLDRNLLDILACPICRSTLIYESKKDILICNNCNKYYSIKDGIPDLIPEHSKNLKK